MTGNPEFLAPISEEIWRLKYRFEGDAAGDDGRDETLADTFRRVAKAAARRAGAIVHGMPSVRTTVVVRGRPNPTQAAGRDAGLKLMEIKRLREKGYKITLLNEAQFWRLAKSPSPRPRRAS